MHKAIDSAKNSCKIKEVTETIESTDNSCFRNSTYNKTEIFSWIIFNLWVESESSFGLYCTYYDAIWVFLKNLNIPVYRWSKLDFANLSPRRGKGRTMDLNC